MGIEATHCQETCMTRRIHWEPVRAPEQPNPDLPAPASRLQGFLIALTPLTAIPGLIMLAGYLTQGAP